MAAESSRVQESASGSPTAAYVEDFAPSQLGTKEYWDNAYSRELQTYRDIGDVGEIWFGEESMNRVIRWMEKQSTPENAAILDIGTGNGVFLVELAKHGFMNLTGIDYSSASVQLATNVLREAGLTNIKVQEQDFLSPSSELKGFDLCIDKGTFDAISLNPEDREKAKFQYINSLGAALKPQGHFVISSCNWTKEQLLQIFSPEYSDDTAVVACLRGGDETEYRDLVAAFTAWSRRNGLCVNAVKTKEMIVDF